VVAAGFAAALAAAEASDAPTAGSDALCGTGPLEILLTNDDGYEATGIRALRTQLGRAGHRVLLVAPDRNASGSSLGFTRGEVRVTRDPSDPNVVGVAATPATAVVLGVTALYPAGRRPDLIVSGINDGANSGATIGISGTVGAALSGTLLLDPPVPGFAVSAERVPTSESSHHTADGRQGKTADTNAAAARADAIAAHFVRLLAASRTWFCESGRVVRRQSILNVNYPALAPGEWRGTVVARHDLRRDLRIEFEATGDGAFAGRWRHNKTPAMQDADRDWLERGYVTVSPLAADLNDESAPRDSLDKRLKGL
jgi:5'-nucleotidase